MSVKWLYYGLDSPIIGDNIIIIKHRDILTFRNAKYKPPQAPCVPLHPHFQKIPHSLLYFNLSKTLKNWYSTENLNPISKTTNN